MRKNIFFEEKITIPKRKKHHIIRYELFTKLDSLYDKYKIILINTFSGAGKTSLIVDWINYRNFDNIFWYSFGYEDNIVKNFISYFLYLFRSIKNKFYEKLEKIIDELLLEDIIYELIKNISLSESSYILVLDDFHNINSHKILYLLEIFFNYLPDNIKVIILSKEAPKININKLKSNFFLFELNNINFNSYEIDLFFKNKGIKITENLNKKILENTDGWVTALNLSYESILNNQEFDKNIIYKYIEEQIFNKLNNFEKKILLSTSILDSFDYNICNYILNIENSNDIINSFINKNIFIINFISKYKYHEIFKNFLFNKLQNENNKLFRLVAKKASIYYKNIDLYKSLNYALMSLDKTLILSILEEYNLLTKNEEEFYLIFQKILDSKLLNEDDFIKNSKCFISYIFFLRSKNDFYKITNLIDTYKQNNNLNSESKIEKNFIYAIYYFLRKDLINSKLYFFKFIDLIRNNFENYIELISLSYKNIAILALKENNINQAIEIIDSGIQICNLKTKTILLHLKLEILFNSNKIQEIKNSEEEIFNFLVKNNILDLPLSLYIILIFLKVSYYTNDLIKFTYYENISNKILEKNWLNSSDILFIKKFLSNLFYKKILLNEFDEKNYLWVKIKHISLFISDFNIINAFNDLIKRIEFFNKKTNNIKTDDSIKIDFYQLNYFISDLYLYIENKIKVNELDNINKFLDKITNICLDKNLDLILIRLYIYKAIILYNSRNIDLSFIFLENAIIKAQENNLINIFDLDYKQELISILKIIEKNIKRNKIDRKFLSQIIQKYNVDTKKYDYNLSKKEKEILELILKDLSNREICENLFISENTLKTHLKKIYKKLNVNKKEQIKHVFNK